MSQFILEFKQALSPQQCNEIIKSFDADPNKHEGRTGNGVDKSKKHSVDLTINHHAHWQPIQNMLSQTLLRALIQYARAHPMILTGALSTSFQDPNTGKISTLSHDQVNNLSDEQIGQIVSRIYELDILNIQKYQKAQGGYPHWHSEHFPHPTDQTQRSLRRSLLILFYLNDIEQGGETEFFYQQAKVKPTQGSLILAPCDFTHTHRGVTPISSDKYVIASWVMFREAKYLYNQQS